MTGYDNIENEMIHLTRVNVRNLMSMWRSLFPPEEYNEHLNLLRVHTTKYYADLIKESTSKRLEIEKSIANLQKEADDLRRLLHTDLQLPTTLSESTPLVVVHHEIDRSLQKLREALRQRRQRICELLLQQEELCEVLGMAPRPLLDDPLPTEEQLQDFSVHLQQLETLHSERTKELANLRSEIKRYMKILEMKVHTDTENRLLHDMHIHLNDETFAELQRMRSSFELKVEELCATIESIRKQLESLWQRLDISPTKRGKYRQLEGYDKRTYDLLLQELQRCETLKRQNLKSFVEQLRTELIEWWDKCMISEKERNRFIHMKNNCYTDDLLVLHEMELEELKQFYEQNKKIFALYAERQMLWERMEALESKANDPGRYNNRGGQLLREEKERKTITSKLPKIEQQIKELVHNYEESEKKTFTINGESILELMEKDWEKKRLLKELQTSSRKGKTPVSKTGRTPLSTRNATSVTKSFLYSTRLTPSQHTMLRTPGVSAQKRTLNEADKVLPSAKRNLRRAMDSPSVLLPSTLQRENTTASVTLKPSAVVSEPKFKTPLRKKIQRVIATTINRRSNGKAAISAAAKRRSMRGKNQAQIPDINIEECTDINTDTDDAYESFQKDIDVRSSIITQGYKKITNNVKQLNTEYTKSTSNRLIPRIKNMQK